jgi:general stress protein 26
MSYQTMLAEDPRATLFDIMEDVRAGMLGLTASGTGAQPMSHHPDEEAGVVWFIASSESDLVQGVGMGEDADYIVISKDHDVHASIRGKLFQISDEAKLDELWSPFVGAWFSGGRQDPRVALLRFDPEKARIWASTTSTLKFGMEIMRANLSEGHKPDVGGHAVIDFPDRTL